MPAPRFHLEIHALISKAHVQFLERHLRAANTHLQRPLVELSIALVNDRTMSDLHQRYLNIAGPTDVLTFPLEEKKRGGEIVICVPEALRRAKEHGASVRNELLLYAIHGMLHLSGMDDRTQRGFERMHRMEDRILSAIGIGPVFDPHRRAGFSPLVSQRPVKRRPGGH